jgi:hypothetical protein
MKLSTTALLGLAACSLAALASCAGSTQLTSSWADPAETQHNFRKIVVVGVTPKATLRRQYEDSFVAELQSRGVTGVGSYTFGGEGQLNQEQAVAKLKEIGADAVIVTRLIDKETVNTYYPPTYSSVGAPSAYYGGWYGYYNTGYSYMSSPGYVSENKVFRIETNLYDVQNDKLAWSGLTETTVSSYDAPDTEVHPLIAALVYDMEKKKVIPAKGKK